jgi:hypothetical protein
LAIPDWRQPDFRIELQLEIRMNKLVLTAMACAIGASACTHLREPTDTQLATLLHSERAAADDANAPLDANAIDCLRGWSNDADLLKGLAMRFLSDDGKQECRGGLDKWLADAGRNPDKLAFADVSAPKTVRRAVDLLAARRMAAIANPSKQIPTAMAPPVAPLVPVVDPKVELGTSGTQLSEAETLCQQVQQAAAAPDASARLKSYSTFCANSLRQLRGSMEQAARNGASPAALDEMAASANNLSTAARNALAAGKQ